MKLRAVELADVRRFAGQVARVDGIGDGVSVLAAPNESGKSTLFDALRALMFHPHTSGAKDLKTLKPHVGGKPRVAAVVEVGGAQFRIEKQWLSGKAARVWDASGRLIAQADEAEAWIARMLGTDLVGPAGLLWVRQGAGGLDGAGPVDTRRDILGAVAGEIDALTGGRRMDAIRARVEADLAALATDQGRPRAGGPWRAALDASAAAAGRATELGRAAQALAGDLQRRQAVERARADLADPGAAADRAARLAGAIAAHQAGQAHAQGVDAARQAVRLAQATRQAALARRDALRRAADEVQVAERAEAEAVRAVADADAVAQTAGAQSAAAEAAGHAAQALADAVATAARAWVRWRQAQAGADAERALAARLAQAEAEGRAEADAQAARAALPITAARLEAARQAAAARDLAATRAQAVTVRFDYSGAARALRGDAPVDGPQHLTGPATFDLPGLGRLHIDPGAAAGADAAKALAQADAALAQALATCGAATLADAAAALARADGFDLAARTARARLDLLAPQGLPALRAEVTRATAQPPTPAPDTAEPTEAQMIAAQDAARRAAADARLAADRAGRAQADLAGAQATHAAARSRGEAARGARGDPGAHAQALAQADADLAQADGAQRLATQDLDHRLAAQPDMAGLQAALTRAQSVVDGAQAQGARLDIELAELRVRITQAADAGVDEALALALGQAQALAAQAEAFGAEVAALTRLRSALAQARAAARGAYFGPVLRELAPLLTAILPGASLAMDDTTLLPTTLDRAGVAEPLDILSGGTREQVAILTRLAFARLLAAQGRGVPVILDDALVQTDDDRIEAMFTALHRAAQGQQVIVLTCRQRAFAALGGQTLRLDVRGA